MENINYRFTYPRGETIEADKETELANMKQRIEQAIGEPEVRRAVAENYIETFKELGIPQQQAELLCEEIFIRLLSQNRLDVIESKILERFESIKIGDRDLIEILHEKLRDRAEIIADQMAPYIDVYDKDKQGRALDFGAGDGQVTQMLQDRYPDLKFEGMDVREYVAIPEVKVTLMVGKDGKVPTPDAVYNLITMSNVAHHEQDNEKVLRETSRIAAPGALLVMIETVPNNESKQEWERTFMNDYLYNRLFHNADVPVPGTYEIAQGWVKRWEAAGWNLVTQEDLGVDQKVIKDTHHMFVFKKSGA